MALRDVDLLTALIGRGYDHIAEQGGSFYRGYRFVTPGIPLLELWVLLGRDGGFLAFEARIGMWRTVIFTQDYVQAQLDAQNWRNRFIGVINA